MSSEIERALARRDRRRGASQDESGYPATLIPLVEMNRALTANVDLAQGLRGALDVLNRTPGVFRSAASLSLPDLAEVVVDGSGEPPRTRPHEDNRFVCTTVAIDGRPIGALAVDLAIADPGTRERMEYVLQALAELIAHSVSLRQLLEARQPSPAEELSGPVSPDETPDPAAADENPLGSEESLSELVSRYEKGLIESALRTTRGNRARAAKLLQTTERIVGYRVQQYGIDCRDFRD